MFDLLVVVALATAPALHLATAPAPPPHLDASPVVLDAVRWAESRGFWFARSPKGLHVGAYQAAVRFAHLRAPLLYLEPLARLECRRHLRVRLRQSGGDLRLALAAYRCGNAGLRGRCGTPYADAVLRRVAGAR